MLKKPGRLREHKEGVGDDFAIGEHLLECN
jgi:hypothetical protein